MAAFPWLADDVNEQEAQALRYIDSIARRDIELLNLTVNFPWVVDGINEFERYALQNISAFAARDTPKAKIVAGFPWVTDDITLSEYNALGRLADLARKDAALIAGLVGLGWMADDITDQERWVLFYLGEAAKQSIALAKSIATMEFYTGSVEDHDIGALRTLIDLSASDLANLVGQDWFTDGLDDEEAAFVSVLRDLANRSPEQFQGMVDTHYTRSITVTLPLAGDVEVIGFRPTPFKTFDPALPLTEDSLRAMEGLMNVAFPQEEVRVLFVDPFEYNPINDFTLAIFVGTHLLVTRPEIIQGDFRHTVAHEMAHYYWNSLNATLWFREGGADFLASYTLDFNGRRTLADRHLDLDSRGVRTCASRGMDSIQELLDLLESQGYAKHVTTPQFLCNYILGEFLLLKLYQSMGFDGSNGAWNELYTLAESEGRPITEDEIYLAFYRSSAEDQLDEVNALYDRWHRGDTPTSGQ